MPRGLDTPVRKTRRAIFKEIAAIGFSASDQELIDRIEAIPYTVVQEQPVFRESIYREWAVAGERVRLAMGMALRPENKPVHITAGIEASNIDQKYYEPPMMQVIPSACAACEENRYQVSDLCQRCANHPCQAVCPRGAIRMEKRASVIDQSKCIRCGKCADACAYHAIIHLRRPCESSCGVGAFTHDEQGRAKIDDDRCVQCGMCMVSCPFGAISDKSQIFQLARAMRDGQEVVAELAPAFVGQFGKDVSPQKLKTALLHLGFHEVYEVALGADIAAVMEAKEYAEKVSTGELPFLLTSCCPSWATMARKHFPSIIGSISRELTPMVATARSIKKRHPDCKVVFIGPCVSKKLEASRTDVRSDVDFVLTFEELYGLFDAKGIDPAAEAEETPLADATAAGRGYAVSGGVAGAVEACLKAYYPQVPLHVQRADGLAECKKLLLLARAGKLDGCLLEGMGCPGGCMSGAGTNVDWNTSNAALTKFKSASAAQLPPRSLEDITLD